jgi:hypothetical protein
MPYVTDMSRRLVDRGDIPAGPGELNYQLSQAIDQYLVARNVSYRTLNDVIGVLECLKLELYRRIAAPYEDRKIEENGDVFLCRNW